MATPKGKRLTIAVCAVAVVLVAGGALWRQREIREQWHLWRLETGDQEAKIAAMQALGELKSTRALPELAKILAEDRDPRGRGALTRDSSPLARTALAACSAIGSEAAEVLFQNVAPTWAQIEAEQGEKLVFRRTLRDLEQMASEGWSALLSAGPAEAVGVGTEDPRLREEYAKRLEQAGRLAEALQQYVLCLDETEDKKRQHFLLSFRLVALGKKYPPAIDVTRKRRDAIEQALLADVAKSRWVRNLFLWPEEFPDAWHFASLNEDLGEPQRTTALFRKLREIKGAEKLREMLLWGGIDALLAEKSYWEIVEASACYEQLLSHLSLSTQLAGYSLLLGGGDPDPALDDETKLFAVRQSSKLYEAFVGAGEIASADALASHLVAYRPKADTFAELIRRACNAASEEQEKSLREQAKAKLSQKQLEEMETAIAQPPSP